MVFPIQTCSRIPQYIALYLLLSLTISSPVIHPLHSSIYASLTSPLPTISPPSPPPPLHQRAHSPARRRRRRTARVAAVARRRRALHCADRFGDRRGRNGRTGRVRPTGARAPLREVCRLIAVSERRHRARRVRARAVVPVSAVHGSSPWLPSNQSCKLLIEKYMNPS
jgi:hypothetical protein